MTSGRATICMEHQLRAMRLAADRVEALEFGNEVVELGVDDAVILTGTGVSGHRRRYCLVVPNRSDLTSP